MAQASGIIPGGSDMSSNDTDRRWPGPVSANATEPSGPPEVTTEPRAAALDVESADAVAVGPRKPPRGNEHTMKNEPAVVLNMTVPMNSPGAPPPPSPEPPPAIARPVPRQQAQAVTVASASRVRERNRTFAIVMGILAIGVILALVIVVVGLLRSGTPEPLVPTAATVAPLPVTATTAVTAPRPALTAAPMATDTAAATPTVAPPPATAAPAPTASHKKKDVAGGI
jgi:hypothetical protein